MLKTSVKFWVDDSVYQLVKVYAMRQHTTVSAVLRLCCNAVVRYQRVQFQEIEKKKQELAELKIEQKDYIRAQMRQKDIARVREELHNDELEMLDAAVQVQIKDEEQEKLKKIMSQPDPLGNISIHESIRKEKEVIFDTDKGAEINVSDPDYWPDGIPASGGTI